MSVPLSFLRNGISPPPGISLGDFLNERIIQSSVSSLLDCLCSISDPAIHSTDPRRPPLCHDTIHSFVHNFFLPNSTSHKPLGPNDRVMVVLPTGPENALALMSIAAYHTCAPVNASCTAEEFKNDAKRLRAKAIVATRDVEDRLQLHDLQEELDCDVIFVEGRNTGPAGLFDMSVVGPSDTRSRSHSQPHSLQDQSLVLHTSGTSGKKKVVPYTLGSLIVGTWAVVHSWNLQRCDVNMNMMPLFHVGGIIRNLWAPMLSGGSTIMCQGFDAIAFWTLSQQLQATWYYAAPTIHHAILSSQPESIDPSRDLNIRMICNAAGGLLPSLAVELQRRFGGAIILPSYGMTECMPIATPPQSYQLERPGCSGLPCGPHMSIRDPLNLEREFPLGKTGAVSVRGLPTFCGYEVSPDLPLDTSAFSSEGWFDSGDLGYMDDDGYLYITGRSKEIINKGGEVISPFEIEEAIVIGANDHVKNTLAFAIDHDVLQETIGVIIVPQPGYPRIGLSQLQDLLRGHLHPSKWPFAIVYMDDLPKNAAGKPLRIRLSIRLGLGELTDSVPVSQRHFEAEVPSTTSALSEPIPCSKVVMDFDAVKKYILSVQGVRDVALRYRHDGIPEGFISIFPGSELTQADVRYQLVQRFPGYCIPDPIHVTRQPLPLKSASDEFDFMCIEREIIQKTAASMSPRALAVRNIIADLLNIDVGMISGQSDFFLLGGNSLLMGKLTYRIRKNTGVSLSIPDIFSNSTIDGISSLIDNLDTVTNTPIIEEKSFSAATSVTYRDLEQNLPTFSNISQGRSQYHPLCLIVQVIPIVFFYPLKAALTWAILLSVLSYLAPLLDGSYMSRMGSLLAAICAARLGSRIICPITAIAFKWIVIGRYKAGRYRMWSSYYLRWWIVNQSIRSAGRGIFAMHPSLEILYARLLGAKIGRNIHIGKKAKLGEYDLLTIRDNSRIDSALIRGFCVERDGYFCLEPITIGRGAVINTYTQIAPGAYIPDATVYGPHSSSHESPSPAACANANRTFLPDPHLFLKALVAWPIIFIVFFTSYIPWLAALYLMTQETFIVVSSTNSLVDVIYWFSAPRRVMFHAFSRILRVVATPLVQLVFGIIVKRIFGLNQPQATSEYSQLTLVRRYLNNNLLSREKLKAAFSILGTHYEIVSIVYRLMGAKIGRRVYWPGSGLICPDPELLTIGNDVVFGSRSELITTDAKGTDGITVGNGAMIADRVVLLPGTTVGHCTVMGSGTLGERNGVYQDGSTWMGSDGGHAICFSKGSNVNLDADTTTPFGRAYHKRQANYFVLPYPILLSIQLAMAIISAGYWSISAVAAAQLLKLLELNMEDQKLFSEHHWYRYGVLYGLIACFFVVVLNLQAVFALLWVIVTKWMVIGRRKVGQYDWDKSSYCQRWQIHLVLSRPLYKGYGNGGVLSPITGSAFIVWYYRALGAQIGKNCCLFPGGKTGLMTEPDLVELGNYVSLDACSVVAHLNSRGKFSLNALKIGDSCALRSGSRLLSGASMEDNSMLCEHTLLTSGEIAETGAVYIGWPGRRIDNWEEKMCSNSSSHAIICPLCRRSPNSFCAPICGHLFCESCITGELSRNNRCPTCRHEGSNLIKILPCFN